MHTLILAERTDFVPVCVAFLAAKKLPRSPLRRGKIGAYSRRTPTHFDAMSDDPPPPLRKLGPHGGRRIAGQSYAQAGVTLCQRGHSRKYILARLARDGRGDLIQAIESGRISAYAAAYSSWGWTRRSGREPRTRRRAFDAAALIG